MIFACSGAADVGEISDRAARQLARDGAGKMFCLAGVGGRVDGIMATTKAASKILAIDGCQLDCAKKTLEVNDIPEFVHVRITDLGFPKGASPPKDETVTLVTHKAASLLGLPV